MNTILIKNFFSPNLTVGAFDTKYMEHEMETTITFLSLI